MAIPSGMIDEIIKSMGEVVKNELVMLWGFKDEFLKLNKKLGKIKRVLHDAENKEFQDQAIREWLVELKDLMYDIEDIIDDCYIHINNTTTTNNTTSPPMSRPSSSTTTSFKKGKRMISKKISAFYKKGKGVVHRHKIGKRIQEINVRLEEINKDRKDLQFAQIEGFIPPPPTSQWSRETTPYVIDSDITGIDDDAKVMVQKLTGSFGGGGGGGGGRVFAIVGMGGIGKTTLAQKVFNKCTEVGEKIWVCVSQNFNEIDILKQIIRSADGNYGVAQTKQDFYSIVKKVLGGKRFLLVLDDLWSDRVWHEGLRIPFSDFTEDCQVLITTRNREIARQMGAVYIHEMKTLSDDDAWSLLRKIVHLDGETEEIDPSIKDLGMKIVKECKGLPLAIKAIGGVLNKKERKKDAWEIVMKSFSADKLSSSEVLPALRLSYMDLPSYLKPCFLYCSLFPEDHKISRTEITRMWMAEGFVKAAEIDVAEAYHEELIARNLLQVVHNYLMNGLMEDLYCKMHDLVRDMAISMTQGEHIFGRPQQHTEGASLKPRRLSIISGDVHALELKEIPLRSLFVFGRHMSEIQGDLFHKLRYLRVLNLFGPLIKRLPDSIGKLIQLRYLDLSVNDIEKLPDSLCNLQNLQTLFLRYCQKLTKLPKDLPHLKELQHICLWQSMHGQGEDVMMPAGIGELVKLQTLDRFTIHDIRHNNGGEGPHNDDKVGCNIHELGSLSHLRCLRIQRLERVQSGAEAKKAMIQNKIHLRSLGLWWSKREPSYSIEIDIPPEEVEMKQMEEVFEEFRPPSSLQVLDVYGFGGRELPSWMMPTSNFLDNLLYLELRKVKFITRLPSLGHLPQLKKLSVVDNQGIVSIGPEFLFGERERRGRGIFPKLEFLLFDWMKVWEEWSDGMEWKEGKSRVTKIGDAGGGGTSLDILPRLGKLTLDFCFRLRTLAGCLVHVRELTLAHCRALEYLWNLPALHSLEVNNCGALKDMTNLGSSSLTQISFRFSDDVLIENNMEALRSVKITDETLLIINGPPGFASKCSVEDGPHTPIIHRFPRVQAFEYGKLMFSYTRSTSETHIQPT